MRPDNPEGPRFYARIRQLHRVRADESSTIFLHELQNIGIDTQLPIIMLAECCFMYLPQRQVDALMAMLKSAFRMVQLILYEPLLADDPFSMQMIRNFHQRRINLESHCIRPLMPCGTYFEKTGWHVNRLLTMQEMEKSDVLSAEDYQLLNRLAALDEYEEWILVSNHYYIAHLSSYQQ